MDTDRSCSSIWPKSSHATFRFTTDSYRREELFEAARRSRACAYLADDDHGPLALQEILLAGCPTVGVRTGASFVRTGETGVVVDRLPPGRQCAESDDDVRALAVFMEAIEQAQSMDRHSVRDRAAERVRHRPDCGQHHHRCEQGPSGRRHRDSGKRIITGVKFRRMIQEVEPIRPEC